MNLIRIILLTILILFLCYSNAVHSSDSDEDEKPPMQKTIVPIDIARCRAIADAINDDSAQDYFESFDPEEEKQRTEDRLTSIQEFFLTTQQTSTQESQADKELRLQREEEHNTKLRERFIKDEKNIRDKALDVLAEHPQKRLEYKKLIKNKNLYPSIAILELTKDINATPCALDLLQLIENYGDYEYEGYFLDRNVELDASYRIFDYYLKEYNKRASSLVNPREMDRSLHDLLHLCQKHLPTHPMSGIDDPEHAMCHIADAIDTQLLTFNLWYIDNPKLIRDLVGLHSLQRLFRLGINFLECTTYGTMPHYFDLGYLLKRKKFVGIKIPLSSNTSEYQHIWIHPYWPLQVRITQNGKLTVGLLKENPLTADKRLTQNSIREDNELYKISMPGLKTDTPDFSSYVIPARHLEPYQKLWAQQLESVLKNDLMATAHGRLEPRDMNFTGMEKYLYHENSEVKPNTNTQLKNNSGKPKKKK